LDDTRPEKNRISLHGEECAFGDFRSLIEETCANLLHGDFAGRNGIDFSVDLAVEGLVIAVEEHREILIIFFTGSHFFHEIICDTCVFRTDKSNRFKVI